MMVFVFAIVPSVYWVPLADELSVAYLRIVDLNGALAPCHVTLHAMESPTVDTLGDALISVAPS